MVPLEMKEEYGADRLTTEPKISAEELTDYLRAEFPQVFDNPRDMKIETLGYGDVTVRLMVQDHHLRPGGTVSGPSMMTLVDCAAYVSVLSMIGRKALAVTTNLNINFLRKPPAGSDLLCDCRPLKLGKSLFVCDALIYGAEDKDKTPLAHATLTYSIPK